MAERAGYSERPLVVKLPPSVRRARELRGAIDVIVDFARSSADLTRRIASAKRALAPAGMLWICWPKKTSALGRDLDGNIVREIGLATGLVDVKVCAVDADWSGLKFVYRLRDRPKMATPRRAR